MHSTLTPSLTPDTLAMVMALSAPVAADLRKLAHRLEMTPSAIAEQLLGDYLDVLGLTEHQGGLGAWLDRLFEVEHEPAPRKAVLLTLPAWQFEALTAYAEMEGTSESVILSAMIGRSLRAALSSGRPGYLFGDALVELLAEHHGEFLAA